MKMIVVALILTALSSLSAVTSSGLYCWLCAGGSGSSFKDCDTRRRVQNCSGSSFQEPGKGPLDRCAYFSFYSLKLKKQIFAKSCTFASYCTESGETFCKNIPGGAKQCQVECCTGQKCNAKEQFQHVKIWPTSTPTPSTDSMWCNWKESDANSHARSVVSGLYLVVAACGLAMWLIASN